ncbi:MAG: hypothetical protein SW833_16525 [Cyanobacteriota bacterium]|nr:hypothetical protein [Cyanobacteriota bacterium]
MIEPNLLEAARQGNVDAIASLLNRSFQPQGIAADASLEGDCLQVVLTAETVPNRDACVNRIRQGLVRLAAVTIKRAKVSGKKTGAEVPAWEEAFAVASQTPAKEENEVATTSQSEKSWLGSIVDAMGSTAAKAGETAQSAATRAGDLFGEAAGRTWEGATGMAGALGSTAAKAGEVAVGTAWGAANAVGGAAGKVTEGTGYLLDTIADNPALKQVAKAFKADWLVALLDRVDVEKAASEVERLKAQYPDAEPHAIAHRLMLQKAMLAGGSGLATSLIPGAATALLAVDIASTTLLHAEMVYQIAGIYGLDLKEPERKAEVLTIFGLSLGGNRAIEAGLDLFFRNIPVAGAVIGAGSNAAMVYALGYGACRFYEAKLNPETSLPEDLETVKTESNEYFEDAIAQETIMDRILVHVVLAGNPGETWAEILPGLQAANLSPASLETIEANLESPPKLETLLEQINTDFGVPLLAQCNKIARLDEAIAPEEERVLATIEQSLSNATTKSLGLTDN